MLLLAPAALFLLAILALAVLVLTWIKAGVRTGHVLCLGRFGAAEYIEPRLNCT
jgi:hypothetical protein